MAIVAMPIPSHDVKNRVAWQLSSDGVYKINLEYRERSQTNIEMVPGSNSLGAKSSGN